MALRYFLTTAAEDVAAHFACSDAEWFPPRTDIVPGQPIAVVRLVRSARRFALVRWSLVPSWAKDMRRPFIHARAEDLLDRPAFRGALQYRRCIVPASGFYVRRDVAGNRGKEWRIAPADGRILGFAGLWDPWLGADGSEIDGALIVTAPTATEIAGLARRMPAILSPRDYEGWLRVDVNSAERSVALLGAVTVPLTAIAADWRGEPGQG
jgi:putative SOS response-associated peptidase YedK